MPYLYKTAIDTSRSGVPTMRSMVLEYTEDKTCHYVDKQYIPYIIDIYNSATWSNGLKVINRIGYPKNRKAINSILYLFQDINWKTTQMAVDTVKEIYSKEPDFVIEAIDNTIFKHRDDEMWVEGLQWLKEKLNE